ncbi:MAG: hypothetical protein ACKPIF_06890 [Microcystis panniformis]
MVRSPKSIAGAVGATLGNAPYKSSDRTAINVHGALPKNRSPEQWEPLLGNAPYGW